MMKLVQLEWMKLKRSVTTKVILAVYIVLVPLMYWMLSLLEFGPIRIPTAGYQFPDTYQLVAWTASYLNLMVGVVVVVITTNELKYKTQRQNVIDGLRKIDIILSKFIVVLGLSLFTSLYVALVAIASGFINGGSYSMFDGIGFVGVYFVSTLGYFTFAYFFANLVRLPALAIIIYIFSTIIEGIVGFIAVKQYVQFFPLTSFSNLAKFPMHFFVVQPPEEGILSTPQAVLLASFYIAIFVASSYWIIKKRDI